MRILYLKVEENNKFCFLNEKVEFLLLYFFEIVYIVVSREISLGSYEICRFGMKEDFFRDIEENVNNKMIFVIKLSYEKIELNILFFLCLNKIKY